MNKNIFFAISRFFLLALLFIPFRKLSFFLGLVLILAIISSISPSFSCFIAASCHAPLHKNNSQHLLSALLSELFPNLILRDRIFQTLLYL